MNDDADARPVGRAARRCSAARIRVSTPFLFVSLGECLTEKSGRVNLGLEGTLVMGAMVGYGVSYLTRLALARRAGARASRASLLGALHALAVRAAARQRHRGRHRADAVRHRAGVLPRQAADPARRRRTCRRSRSGFWSDVAAGALGAAGQRAVPDRPRARAGAALGAARTRAGAWSCARSARAPTPRARWATTSTRVRLLRDHGRRLPRRHRRLVPVAVLPGQLERGAVERPGADGGGAGDLRALGPVRCLYASLLFGGASALGPALQSVGVTSGYYLFNAAPYALTLVIMVADQLGHAARSPDQPARADASRDDARIADDATSPPTPTPGPSTAICAPRTPRWS